METLGRITIPMGTELNTGVHEDADFYTLNRNIEAEVQGPIQDGALPIKIIGPDGIPIEPVLYYHQPVLSDTS